MYKPRFFTETEFVHAVPSCSLSDMSDELLERLDTARAYLGAPLYINSAFRTREYELIHGREGSSSHCKGLAVDIKCNTSEYRLQLVKSLFRAGFRRIGISRSFVHADIDKSKPHCLWLYD